MGDITLKQGDVLLVPFYACFDEALFRKTHDNFISYLVKGLSEFLFPDAIEMLKWASKGGVKVRVLVKGDCPIERSKFFRSGITELIGECNVCFWDPARGLGPYLDANERSVFVDTEQVPVSGHPIQHVYLNRSDAVGSDSIGSFAEILGPPS